VNHACYSSSTDKYSRKALGGTTERSNFFELAQKMPVEFCLIDETPKYKIKTK